MGFFSSKPTPPAKPASNQPVPLFSFTSPHGLVDTYEALLTGLADLHFMRDGAGQFIVEHHPDQPPLKLCLYFTDLSKELITLKMGNRTMTHWTLTFQMESSGSGTKGTVVADRRKNRIKMEQWGDSSIRNYAFGIYIGMPKILTREYGFRVKSFPDYN